MKIERRFTAGSGAGYGGIGFNPADADLVPVGLEIPAGWSALAAQVLARDVLCRSGVPARLKPVPEPGVPEFLWRSVADDAALAALPPAQRHGPETSARQVIDRMAGAWGRQGWLTGHFASESEARTYVDEMRVMLARQMGAPAPAQWAATGLWWAYGITAPTLGEVSPAGEGIPGPRGVTLHRVPADPLAPDGLLALALRETRGLARGGVATGSNISNLSGELATLLSVGDRALATSGAERPARLVVCDADHPGVAGFIAWKPEGDHRVAALVAGARVLRLKLGAIVSAVASWRGDPGAAADPGRNPTLLRAIQAASRAMVPDGAIARVLGRAAQGLTRLDLPLFATDWDNPAWEAAPGRLTATAVRLTGRPDPGLLDRLAATAWDGAAPMLMFRDAIEACNPCPQDGELRATAPGGDILSPEDSSTPLATLNLLAFWRQGRFDIAGFSHAVRLWTLTLDITLGLSHYPSETVAARTAAFRPLGLGFANLGPLLMSMGVPWASDQGRATCAALAALMTGTAWATSAGMAAQAGPCAAAARHHASLIKQLERQQAAALDLPDTPLTLAAQEAWDTALTTARRHGLRQTQVTLIPAGDSSTRLMDVESDGIAPDFALIKDRVLCDGSHLRLLNPSVPAGLARLGYSAAQIAEISAWTVGHGSLEQAPHINHATLGALGFGRQEIARAETALPGALDLRHVFNPWTLGKAFCMQRLGIPARALSEPTFDLLAHLGFSPAQIAAANAHVRGAMTLEGAPHLDPRHLPVFDCARPAPGDRRPGLPPEARLRMAAAAQRFVSAGVALQLDLPEPTTIAQIRDLWDRAQELGLKTLQLDRTGADLSLPRSDWAATLSPDCQPAP